MERCAHVKPMKREFTKTQHFGTQNVIYWSMCWVPGGGWAFRSVFAPWQQVQILQKRPHSCTHNQALASSSAQHKPGSCTWEPGHCAVHLPLFASTGFWVRRILLPQRWCWRRIPTPGAETGCRAEQEPSANYNLPPRASAPHQNIATATPAHPQAPCCLANSLRSGVVTSFELYMKTVDFTYQTLAPHSSG